MKVAPNRKKQLVADYRRHTTDSGSSEVQVALLTEQITSVTDHLKGNKHDHAARRGLSLMVGKRNRHLRYLSRTEPTRYQALIKRLGLRK